MGFLIAALVFTFSPIEAQLVLGLLASIAVPFVTAFFSRPDTNKWVKFAVAIVLSLIGGGLTVYISGALTGSVLVAGAAVFAAAQVHFASWFKGLDLKAFLEGLGSTPVIEVELEDHE